MTHTFDLDMLSLSVVLIFLKWFQSWFSPCWGGKSCCWHLVVQALVHESVQQSEPMLQVSHSLGTEEWGGVLLGGKGFRRRICSLHYCSAKKGGNYSQSSKGFVFLIVVLCSIALRDVRYILNKLLEEIVKIIIEAFFFIGPYVVELN